MYIYYYKESACRSIQALVKSLRILKIKWKIKYYGNRQNDHDFGISVNFYWGIKSTDYSFKFFADKGVICNIFGGTSWRLLKL